MKKNKTLVICTAAFMILSMLSGCAKNEDSTSTEVSTTIATSLTTEKTTAVTTVTTTTTTTETTATANENTYPERLFIEDFISPKLKDKAADIKKVREEFSKTNKFFDFELIEEVEKTEIPDEDKTKAITLAADEQAYKDAIEPWYLLENFVSYDLITSGEAKPEFNSAYEFDFDGDGKTERFILVDVPQTYEDQQCTASLLIYEDSSSNMSVVGFGDSVKAINIIDYGEFKQFVLSCNGLYGYREHAAIYGVVSGKLKKLNDERIISMSKIGCFLFHNGPQGFSELLIYDTANNEYRPVYGYPVDTKKLRELDTNGDITEIYGKEDYDDSSAYFVYGEKYLVGRGGMGCYAYENGRFTNKTLLFFFPQMFMDEDSDIEWFDVDIDYAWESSGAEF